MKKSYKIALFSFEQENLSELLSIISSIDRPKYQVYSFSKVSEYINFLSEKRVELLIINSDLENISIKDLHNRIVEACNDEKPQIIFFSKECLEDQVSTLFEIGAIDIFRPPLYKDEISYKLYKHIHEYKNFIKEFNRTQKQLERVTRISDRQQSELKDLNEELDKYKLHLEDKVEDGLKEIKDLNREIEDTQREVIFTMGAIGESRSKETGNHVKRVAEYSYLLAVEYGLSEREAEMLKQASPMHDIGKVAIPDAILNKPARFTEDEFIYMQRHSELGYDMLKHSQRELIQMAATVAYEHHEKWNGKGYPRGLKGEDIHIYGRITAVADVFDALGSDRVYKKAWSDEEIFKLFKEERGEHFDPTLVDIFFANLDAILKIRDKFKD